MEIAQINEILRPRYSAQQLVEASGLSGVLVQQYCGRGLLRFEAAAAGGRIYRRFSYLEVLVAGALACLRNLGVFPSEAFENVREMVGQWCTLRDEIGPDARFAVFPEGKTPFFSRGSGSVANCIDAIPHMPLNPLRRLPIFGKSAGFVAIDLPEIERVVRERLGKDAPEIAP